jgi:hypothetical protein
MSIFIISIILQMPSGAAETYCNSCRSLGDAETHNVTWTVGVLPFADQNNTAHVEGGDILNLVSTGGDHDVVKFLNEAHYDACSFQDGVVVHATQRVPFSETVVVDSIVDNNVTSSDDVRWDYYGCSVTDHCRRNIR